MHLIFLALGVIIGVYILLKWVGSLDSVSLARALKYLGIVSGVITVLLMILTGRVAQGLCAFLVLLPFVIRWARVKYKGTWRKQAKTFEASHFSQKTNMTLEEAYEILDLPKDATQKEVMASFRKLMAKLHPDKGGNSYLTSQIIEAKNLIIDHLHD